MGKTTLDQIPLMDVTDGKKQPFARKVAVVAYYLRKENKKENNKKYKKSHKKSKKKKKINKPQAEIPHFLLTVIVPKQPAKVTNKWRKAKRYKLPGGFSLIKGSREMIRAGKRVDIPPAFGGYFRKKKSGNLKKKDRDKSIDGLLPAALTSLREAKEEGGVNPKNIRLIYDLGVRQFRISGKRRIKVDTFAIELKGPKNGKAIDSLAVDYFTLEELKQAIQIRTQYNIPLVRPSHLEFIKDVLPDLKKQYKLEGRLFSDKLTRAKKTGKKNNIRKSNFIQLIKNARQGKFLAYKYSTAETRENIIEKSIDSRERQKKTPRGKF
ncbi:MAG: hypothetical protein GY781_06835 [Gammaproteobacteria bacterium]|nr:hypothetical protein [Gammaproteobacteria bacterium]